MQHRADFLAECARKNNWSLGVELGVKEGKTLDRLLEKVPCLSMVGVDYWKNVPNAAESYDHWDFKAILDQAKAIQNRHKGRCTLLQMSTLDAAKYVYECDFVFIDADHSFDAVVADIKAWSGKTDWLFGHDIDWPSVKAAVEQTLGTYNIGPDNVWWSTSSV